MTNRIQYQDHVEQQTPATDIQAIREMLEQSQQPLTLDNARQALAKGLARKPEGWVITLAELPELWAEQVTT
jgi:hypothetical protein